MELPNTFKTDNMDRWDDTTTYNDFSDPEYIIRKFNTMLASQAIETDISQYTDRELIKELKKRNSFNLYTNVSNKLPTSLNGFTKKIILNKLKIPNRRKFKFVLFCIHYLNLLNINGDIKFDKIMGAYISITTTLILQAIDSYMIKGQDTALGIESQLLTIRTGLIFNTKYILDFTLKESTNDE